MRRQQTICGNNSLGRNLVNYCLNSSLPGVKYMVYCPDHVMERAVWGILWILCIFLAIFCSVWYSLQTSEHPFIITLTDEKVRAPLPPVIICPDYAPSTERIRMVEEKLPVMKIMWNMWDGVRTGQLQGEEMPWKNESQQVQRLFTKVMYEGGRMAMDDCEDIIDTCDGERDAKDCCQHSQKIFTKKGLCLEISQTQLKNREDQVGLKKDFLEIHQLLSITVKLEFIKSGRIGHPVLSLPFWGETYLCDSQWGEEEAQVICRGRGYRNGRKFYKSKPRMVLSSFGEYFGKFDCTGSEDNLLDCPRTIINGCKIEEKISTVMCDVGGLDGVHMKTKTKGYPYLEGARGEEYFCKDSFGLLEASVFCRMMSWTVGKVTLAPDDRQVLAAHNHRCEGKELSPHNYHV